MINLFYNAFRLLAVLVAIWIGSIPLILSFVCGTLTRSPWLAYPVALAATAAITVYSSWYPETFRLGAVDLMVHDGIFIMGIPDLAAALGRNLLLAYLGTLTGMAARQGYHAGKSDNTGTDGVKGVA